MIYSNLSLNKNYYKIIRKQKNKICLIAFTLKSTEKIFKML